MADRRFGWGTLFLHFPRGIFLADSTSLDDRYRIGWSPFLPGSLVALAIYAGGAGVAVSIGPHWGFSAWSGLFVLGFFLVMRRNQRRQLNEHLAVVELVRSGAFAEAARRLDAMCERPSSIPSHMMLVFSRAVTAQCMGNFDTALLLYQSVLDARGWGPRRVLYAYGDLYAARAAEAYAWAGQLEPARDLLRHRVAPESTVEASVLPQAILALRGGNASAALGHLDAGWEDLMEVRNELEMAPAHLVYLQALLELGRQNDPKWSEHRSALTPESLRVSAWTGAKWNEMEDLIRELEVR